MIFDPKLYKLSNGITVIFDHMDIETAIVSVCFHTGTRDEKKEDLGITHFCEHMLCKGTKKFPTKKSIDEYMELHSGIRNAGTGYATLCFGGKILAENLNFLIDLFGEQLQYSLFDSEKIELEKDVIIDELRRAMDEPEEQLEYFISNTLFNGVTQSYATLGTVDTIRSFTRDKLLRFVKERLSAQNCIICITGNIINTEETLKCLEKNFNFLPNNAVKINSDIKYYPAIAHNLRKDTNNIKLRLILPDIWAEKYDNLYAQKCVDKFEVFLYRKLFRILRYEHGLVYDCSGSNIGNEKKNWNVLATESSAQHIGKILSLIAKNAYDFYTNNSITEDDLYRLRCSSKLFNADWLESASARCRTLVSFYYNYGKVYDFYKSVDADNRITLNDIIENSRGYFDGKGSIITQGNELKENLSEIWIDNFR